MIQFRCWYCDRRYEIADGCIGAKVPCQSCKSRLRVPARSGGNSRHRTIGDRVIEFLIYGTAGAVLACLVPLVWLVVVLLMGDGELALGVLGVCALVGLIVGGLWGETGVTWLRRLMGRGEDADSGGGDVDVIDISE